VSIFEREEARAIAVRLLEIREWVEAMWLEEAFAPVQERVERIERIFEQLEGEEYEFA
jgi:hypothetical protein